MMVPLVKVGMPDPARLMPALEATLMSGQIGEGEQVRAFEEAFARDFGLPHALAMSSGTAALHACLTLAGVTPGDEVVSTAMTAEPTNVVILHAGARPVFADVDPASGNLDPVAVEAAITSRTRAILVVHYAGYPVRMAEIMAIAARHGLTVIEDCAHALGARCDGLPIGTLGDFGIFSLQAIKHMTTGDGGMLIMKDETLLPEARRFRWFGLERGVDRTQTNIHSVGYKYNMNNISATIGLSQMEIIQERIAAHIANGRWFDAELAAIPGLTAAYAGPGAEPSYWLYTLLSDDSAAVIARLADIGVQASKLHRRNDAHAIFAGDWTLPGLDLFYDRLVHLPCGWWVDSETRERIVDALRRG
jgi:dTDP-4-amino-4,6-dideoxygalactose transaminase